MTISPRLSRMLIAAAVALASLWSFRTDPSNGVDMPAMFSQGETTACGIVDTFHGQTVCVYRLTPAQERERTAFGKGIERAKIIAAIWPKAD